MLLLDTTEKDKVEVRILFQPITSWFKKWRMVSQPDFIVAYTLSDREQVIKMRDTLNEWIERDQPRKTRVSGKAERRESTSSDVLASA
jgi:hypothetical protein